MRGPGLLLLGIALFGMLDANTKLLSGSYPLGQVIALRYIVLLALLLGVFAWSGGAAAPWRTRRPGLHLLRAAAMLGSAAGFFTAFRQLPLAEGYLVFFVSPFLTLALSALVLRERVAPAAWAWCGVAFAGIAIAVAPGLGSGGPPLGYVAAAAGTLGFSVVQTINRRLRDEPGLGRLLLWPSVLGVLAYGPLAAAQWVAAPPRELGLLLLNGVFAGGGVLATATALRHADAARLGPWNFAALPVAIVFDAALWGVWPGVATLLGGGVVIFACLMSERAVRPRLPGAARADRARPAVS